LPSRQAQNENRSRDSLETKHKVNKFFLLLLVCFKKKNKMRENEGEKQGKSAIYFYVVDIKV
jgi:hypothetical protein